MKKTIPLILTYLFIAALSLALLEVSLRIFLPIRHWFPEDMYTTDTDPTISYRLTPGFEGKVKTAYFNYDVHIGNDGYRLSGDNTYQEDDAHKQVPIIAFFGDSFMFGQGVEDNETVPSYVKKKKGQLKVLNAGVYGYTPHQEFITYKRLADKQTIDTIVLQLFNNDIVIQGEVIKRGVYHGFLNADMPTTAIERVKSWLLSNFEIMAQTRRLIYLFLDKDANNGPPEFLSPSFAKSHALEIASTEKLLLAWADEARRRNQKFIIYYIPTVMEIAPEFSDQRKQWSSSARGYDPEASYRWLSELCNSRPDIILIDIKKSFQQAQLADDTNLYILEDGHTNARGNEVIAEEVVKALTM